MEEQTPKKTTPTPLLIVLLLIIISAGLFVYQYRGAIHTEMAALKLVPMPERFTELYFTDPSAIPTTALSGGSLLFSFTISNEEGTSTVYPYIVYFKNSTGGGVVLKSSSVSLPDNTSTTIPVSYTFPSSDSQPAEQGEVIIELPSQNDQQIDFFLPKNDNS